ncbi:MAG: VWA domain-containing protein [bacterium]|nr:VWA domain-containing protein [bacterium]
MKLMGKDACEVHKTLSDYQFSGVGTDSLDGSEYTIVQLLVDASSSVSAFRKDLEKTVKHVMEACKKSPRSENLLFRVALFSGQYKGSIEELHGFTVLSSIDAKNYMGSIRPCGATPLYDAALSSLESLEVYGGSLADQDYLVNAILFVMTDGCENVSRIKDAGRIKKTLKKIRRAEKLESVRMILIGIDDLHINNELNAFKDEAGFDEYVSMGDVKPEKLAKLAQFVSQSISAASRALGTGGASSKIGFVF